MTHYCENCCFESNDASEMIDHCVKAHGGDLTGDLDGHFLSRDTDQAFDTV